MKTQNLKSKTNSLPEGSTPLSVPRNGSAFVMVVVSMVILTTLGLGMLTLAYGARHRAIRLKSEAAAMLAAEAGYEKAVHWMGRQPDMLSALQSNVSGTKGALTFTDAGCEYQIKLFTFLKHRPIYQVISTGHSGVFTRAVDVLVVQAMSGWDMGMCRVPTDSYNTYPVNFATGEIIDIPLHINDLHDSPDNRDIYISGYPQFIQLVTMGEKRYTDGGGDKYAAVLDMFEGGIYFSQPDSRITDEEAVQIKANRFKDSTKDKFVLSPVATAPSINRQPAVQLEFFVDAGIGKVRITDNCTVRGFMQSYDSRTWDFRIKPGSDGTRYEKYYIYAYHLMPENADTSGERFVVPLSDTYVSQSYGEYESEPGGQIYVDGNVIIGSGDPNLPNQDTVKGNVTVVASGNIWIADSVVVDGAHDPAADGGLPSESNTSVLGLITQGVVRIVDPGMSDYDYVDDKPVVPPGFKYVPIGRPDYTLSVEGDSNYHKRHLPNPTVIEAAITIGGGGWGAENVQKSYYGGRKEFSSTVSYPPRQAYLVLRGTLVEAVRGVVGLVGSDGYLKHYYFDERLLEGILPGDIWLRGKYVPAPAGWHDYRAGG
ncbi:MAG: hypothetical protein JW720_14055 [Sedimentisphaerales bacterium]|nr:hypothetical protein [Sedimentisphaerales bacterium]